jgi:hypothetical protein
VDERIRARLTRNEAAKVLAPSQLRGFALTTGGMFAAVFGVLLPWLFGLRWPVWPWVLCAGLVCWGLAHPSSLQPVHAAWMRGAEAMGRVNNRIVLTTVFFAAILPFGWLRRLFGGDPMARRFEKGEATYRKPKAKRKPDSMERPY